MFVYVCDKCSWDGPEYCLMNGHCPVCLATVTETEEIFEEDTDGTV